MLEFTREEADNFIAELQKGFDVVRIVNAATAMPVTLDNCGKPIEGESCCYALWKRDERCDNCITARALSEKARVMKFEVLEDDYFFVIANYTEIDRKPYVIEVGVKLDESVMLSGFGKSEIAQNIMNYNHKLYRDALTGAYNRQYYDEQVAADTVDAVAMLDLDDLKKINDNFGHAAGDRALQFVVSKIQDSVRGDDKVVRYGGDEFILTMKAISPDMFSERMEEIRKNVSAIAVPEYPELKVSVSIGGITGHDAVRDMLEGADDALYKSKKNKDAVTIVARAEK